MGKRKWTEDYFSKRLRAERERRKWTQTELADQLDAKGIPMHWTTIAKIEKGDRSVRIDEAAGIADLLGVSVDSLLGRRVDPQNDFADILRSLKHAAGKSVLDVGAVHTLIQGWFMELHGFDEYEGWGNLDAEGGRALGALSEAQDALWRISAFELNGKDEE